MKIQNVIYKFLILLFFFNLAQLKKVSAQEEQQALLQTADSLFERQEYTESFQLYEQLYQQAGVYTPAMLLKMAFIQEGSGEYSEALYYLNEYYLLTSDKAAIQKMQQLSDKYNLRGYDYQDYDLLIHFLRQYRYVFIYTLLTLALAGLVYLAFFRKQQQSRSYGLGITYVLILGLLFFLTNYHVGPRQAIISADYAYIMAGPSAGAKVVEVSQKGHRVKVEGQEDVWAKIEWEGETAFIRQNNLRLIEP